MPRYKSGAGGIIPPDPDYEAWLGPGVASGRCSLTILQADQNPGTLTLESRLCFK